MNPDQTPTPAPTITAGQREHIEDQLDTECRCQLGGPCRQCLREEAEEDRGGEKPAPAPEGERVVLSASAREPNRFFWPSGRLAVERSRIAEDRWLAWPDTIAGAGSDHYTSPEAAADHLGARLPAPPVSGAEAPDASPYDDDLARKVLEWRSRGGYATERVYVPVASLARLTEKVETQAEKIRQLERERDGWIERTKEADTAQAKAAGMLSQISLAIDSAKKFNAPDQSLPNRVREMVRYIASADKEGSHYSKLCSEAHDALDTAGIPPGGQPADRIRALAGRASAGMNERDQCIAAELLLHMEDRAAEGEPCRPEIVRALRLAVGIES